MGHPVYFVTKYLAVAAYHALLEQLGLGKTFKLLSFLLITPVVKYFYFNKLSTPRERTTYALSVIGDIFMALIFHYVCMGRAINGYYWLFPFAESIPVVAWEYLSFKVLKDEKYTIRTTDDPKDNLLMCCVSAVNVISGLAIAEFGRPVTWANVLALGFTIAIGDLGFGILHYLSHRIPFLWRHHMRHHEYHRDDLTSFANFYSSLLDGLMMNVGIIFCAGMMHGIGGPWAHEIIQMEYLYPALYTHSKYPRQQMHYIYLYELDLIDMVLVKERTADYHNMHHKESNGHFCVFGTFSDSFIRTICDPFLPPEKKKVAGGKAE